MRTVFETWPVVLNHDGNVGEHFLELFQVEIMVRHGRFTRRPSTPHLPKKKKTTTCFSIALHLPLKVINSHVSVTDTVCT